MSVINWMLHHSISLSLGALAALLYFHLKKKSKSLGIALMFPDTNIPCRQLLRTFGMYHPEEWVIHFRLDKRQPVTKQNNAINEFFHSSLPSGLFIENSKFECPNRRCSYNHHLNSPATQVFLLISLARHKIDICVYSFTSTDILSLILALHNRRGVAIRVITDNVQETDVNANVKQLQEAGIPTISLSTQGFYMHHKFCLLDDTILMSGSMNWTRNAFIGNSENVIISRDFGLVEAFKDEFEKLWKS